MNGSAASGQESASGSSITVVMPVFNGAATLPRSLPPLLQMQRDAEVVEVLVVDDGSDDDSRGIAERLGAQVVASGGRLGPGGARNVAARFARGDILWFVDADVIVHNDAARVLANAMADGHHAAVFGAYDDRPPARNFLSQYKNLVHRYYHHRAPGRAHTFWAGCGAVRAPAFAAVGGFDAVRFHRPSIEDIDLGLRLGAAAYRIAIVPALLGTHLKEWRLLNLLRTEIFARALPWSRLIHANPRWPETLNVAGAERWRAGLALALLATGVVCLVVPSAAWSVPLLAIAIAVANAPLFRFFSDRRGVRFAAAGILFHQVYYLYASAAFAWTWLEHKMKTTRNGA